MASSIIFLSAAAVLSAGVTGLTHQASSRPVGQLFPASTLSSRSSTGLSASGGIYMDTEGDSIDRRAREKLTRSLFGVSSAPKTDGGFGLVPPMTSVEQSESPSLMVDQFEEIDAAEAKHGMPWSESINVGSPLLYMNHWEWQLDFMKKTLTNLRLVESEEKFEFQENSKKKARIVNLCFRSDEYRKIRMTYYDAGEACQVFNSVFYPDAKYNLPVLGADVLAFNRKRHLAIVDFQPLHDEEDKHSLTYEDRLLAPIKKDFPSINDKMSSKFYDETQFFSQQMLFARFEDEAVVEKEVFPAFQRYVESHVAMVRECEALADDSIEGRLSVLDRQAAYDTYSAERDPAAGLFTAMFGKEWADDFMHDFLFSMSERKVEEEGSKKSSARPNQNKKESSKRRPTSVSSEERQVATAERK